MKTKSLFLIWGGCYIFCLLLSFIPVSKTFIQVLHTICSAGFFVPGGLLLYRGIKRSDYALLKKLRLISGLSLLLTCVMILVNLLSVTGSSALGIVMHILLLVVSVPMASSGFWLLSLFLWACIFMSTFVKKR